MKYAIIPTPAEFKPVEVNLVFETKEELKNFVKAFDCFEDDKGIPFSLYSELDDIVKHGN